MSSPKGLDVSAAVGSLLTAHNLVACRPTGLRVILNKTGYLCHDSGKPHDYARIQVADVCAGDWYVVARDQDKAQNGEAA